MGAFNLIETFFFLTLGITFGLIILLVYHFKRRLDLFEQKNDTIFEIVNNVLLEISSIKQKQNVLFMLAKSMPQTEVKTMSGGTGEKETPLNDASTKVVETNIHEDERVEIVKQKFSEIADILLEMESNKELTNNFHQTMHNEVIMDIVKASMMSAKVLTFKFLN